jgi:hypothetical protein
LSAGGAWLAVFLLLPVAGWPLLSHPGFARFSLPARAVLAGGAAALLLSFAMTVSALFGLPWRETPLLVAAALLAGATRWLLPAGGRDPGPEPERAVAPVAAAALLAFLGVLAAAAATASSAATSPDLVLFWGAKAQQFASARTVDAAFLGSPLVGYMHPYYPPLVTNLYAFATMAAGRFSWRAATLTFPLVLGALALGLPGLLRRSLGRSAAGATSALAIAAIAYLGIEADVGGNAEMPLLLFETLAVAVLLSPEARSAPAQLLAGLLLAGAATAKVEGLPFAVAAAVLFPLTRPDAARPRGKSFARLLAPTAVALGAWFAFGVSRHLFYGYTEYGRLVELYPGHWRSILRSMLATLAGTGHGLPYLVPLLCLLASGRLRRSCLLPLGTAAALLAFLIFTYFHREGDPALWISWSAARVLSPLAMLLALAAPPLLPEPDGFWRAGGSPRPQPD